jgi:anti-anti-sigma factor
MWSRFSRTKSDSGSEPAPTPRAISTTHPIADIEPLGDTAVATITASELSQNSGASQLSDLLISLAESGVRHVILDVQNVGHMDSTCAGCLVDSLIRISDRGGRIALVNPDPTVAYMFKLSRLDRVFPICRDVMSALSTIERGNGDE